MLLNICPLLVAWRTVIDGVLEARAAFHLKQLPLGVMGGPRVLGVIHDAVIFLLEQLQGAASCKHHRFRFHRCDDIEEELPLNPSGCARAEVYARCIHINLLHGRLFCFVLFFFFFLLLCINEVNLKLELNGSCLYID